MNIEQWRTASNVVTEDLPAALPQPASDLQYLGASLPEVFSLRLPPYPGPRGNPILSKLEALWDLLHHELPIWQGYVERTKGDPAAIKVYCEQLSQRVTALDSSRAEIADAAQNLSQSWQGPAAQAFARVMTTHQGCWQPVELATTRSIELLYAAAAASGRARFIMVTGLIKIFRTTFDLLAATIGTVLQLVLTLKISEAVAVAFQGYRSIAGFIGDALEHIIKEATASCRPANVAMGELDRHTHQWNRAGILLRTGRDIGGPDTFESPDEGSWADSLMGPEPQVSDYEMALLAESIYDDDLPAGPIPGTDFTALTPEQLQAYGIDPSLLVDAETGFHAAVFQDSQGHIVIAYRGTEFGQDDNIDAAEDAFGAMTMSGQTANAIALAQAVTDTFGNENVAHAGHSLGGRLAAAAALSTGTPAVTWNAAGLGSGSIAQIAAQVGVTPEELLDFANTGGIRAYATDQDILTQLQERGIVGIDTTPLHDAPGVRINAGPGEHEDFVEATERTVLRSYRRIDPQRFTPTINNPPLYP